MRAAYLGRPDPVVNGSQNPIGCCELPEAQPFLQRSCGCGSVGGRDFLPGHEIRAVNDRIRAHFGGSPLKFIQRVDGVLCTGAALRGKAS
ncbi:hypothetical protein [Actinosynnema sp. NPDC023587]|uniref:hypothetical protein n=1 Tax=Actinosynnema sp. NPDC023587 TaxID=3154695 RepID=UPI0033C183A1